MYLFVHQKEALFLRQHYTVKLFSRIYVHKQNEVLMKMIDMGESERFCKSYKNHWGSTWGSGYNIQWCNKYAHRYSHIILMYIIYIYIYII